MTAPTQAQIEAAAKALVKRWKKREPMLCDLETAAQQSLIKGDAQAALTAAAEVGWPPDGLADNLVASATEEDSKVEHYPMGKPVITAAAEAGEQVMTPSREPETAVIRPDRDAVSLELLGRDREIARLQNEIDNIEAATIERCAQVARDTLLLLDYPVPVERVVAAIRAMKEEK